MRELRSVWLVDSGNHSRWFYCEQAAREFANDRYDEEVGVPCILERTELDLIARLNELETKDGH